MAVFCDEYAVTATATKITDAFTIPGLQRHARQITLRNNPGAANDAFFGNSTVTVSADRGGVLRATDTMPTVIGAGDVNDIDIGNLYIIGTAGAANIVFVTIVF